MTDQSVKEKKPRVRKSRARGKQVVETIANAVAVDQKPDPTEPKKEDIQVIQGEVVEGQTTELVVREQGASLTSIPLGALMLENPAKVIEKVTEVAKELMKIVDTLKLFKVIRDKKFVYVEGWEILGGMLGVGAHEESSIKRPDGSWESVVVLKRHSDGAVIGRASAIVSRDEEHWGNADDYAVKSMSITRATGKAFRLAFSWIMKLAGYEPTPAEEMQSEEEKAREDTGTTNTKTGITRPTKPNKPDLAKQMIADYAKSKGLDVKTELSPLIKAGGKKFEDWKWSDLFDAVDKFAEEKKNPPAPVSDPTEGKVEAPVETLALETKAEEIVDGTFVKEPAVETPVEPRDPTEPVYEDIKP